MTELDYTNIAKRPLPFRNEAWFYGTPFLGVPKLITYYVNYPLQKNQLQTSKSTLKLLALAKKQKQAALACAIFCSAKQNRLSLICWYTARQVPISDGNVYFYTPTTG